MSNTKRFTADFSDFQPNVSLIVSGGHTLLVLVESELKHRVLGSTMDDAAGECFDKTGKLMGLPYPAGPEIDRLAESGNPKAFDFPRPLLNDPSDDFSFSGLKTSVRYFLRDHPDLLNNAQVGARFVRQHSGGHCGGAGDQNHPRGQAQRRPLRNGIRRRDLQPRACGANWHAPAKRKVSCCASRKESLHRQRGDDWNSGGTKTIRRRSTNVARPGNHAGLGTGVKPAPTLAGIELAKLILTKSEARDAVSCNCLWI